MRSFCSLSSVEMLVSLMSCWFIVGGVPSGMPGTAGALPPYGYRPESRREPSGPYPKSCSWIMESSRSIVID